MSKEEVKQERKRRRDNLADFWEKFENGDWSWMLNAGGDFFDENFLENIEKLDC